MVFAGAAPRDGMRAACSALVLALHRLASAGWLAARGFDGEQR